MGCVPGKENAVTVGFTKERVRGGLPDRERGEYYRAMLVRTGGGQGKKHWERDVRGAMQWGEDVRGSFPEFVPKCPLFGGKEIDRDYFKITEAQSRDVSFLLATVATRAPTLEYLPLLVPSACILTKYLRIYEAYEALMNIVAFQESWKHAVPQRWESKKFMRKIVKKKLGKKPEEYDLEGLIDSFEVLYCNLVGLDICLQLFDVMLSEGAKVLYRMGLIIVSMKDDDKGADLIQAMFGIGLSRDELKPDSDDDEPPNSQKPDVYVGGTVRFRPVLHDTSRVLTRPEEWEWVYSWIPAVYIKKGLRKVFDINADGCSLRSLIAACTPHPVGTIILMKTQSPGQPSQTTGYFLSHGLALSRDQTSNLHSFPFSFHTRSPSPLHPSPPTMFITHCAVTPDTLILGLLKGSSWLHFTNGTLQRCNSDPGEVGLPLLAARDLDVMEFEVLAFTDD